MSTSGNDPNFGGGQQGGYPQYPGGGGNYPPQGGGYQPGGYAGGQPPSNYLGWSIAATLLCCLPLGIPGIIFAAQVNDKWNRGDVEGADKASRMAKNFTIASAVVGLVSIVLYIILMSVGVLALDASNY